MTVFDFDEIIDRKGHHSAKWGMVEGDCLPMWVADMDFRSPPSAIDAMIERAQHGVFGYTMDPPQLKEVVAERMQRLYNWQISPEDVLFSPGLVLALCATCRGFGKPGDAVLIQTPVYGSFFKAVTTNQKFTYNIDMQYVVDDAHSFHYENDYDAFEAAAREPQTSIHLQCNPQNPAGFMYSRAELERIGEICLANDVLIVADEIHSDLDPGRQAHPHGDPLGRNRAEHADDDRAQQDLQFGGPGLLGVDCAEQGNPRDDGGGSAEHQRPRQYYGL